MRKADFDGKIVDTEVMEYDIIKHEQWSVYKLGDGTILKAKLAINEIVKMHGAYLPNGEPMYQVFTSTLLSSQALPENLKGATSFDTAKLQ